VTTVDLVGLHLFAGCMREVRKRDLLAGFDEWMADIESCTVQRVLKPHETEKWQIRDGMLTLLADPELAAYRFLEGVTRMVKKKPAARVVRRPGAGKKATFTLPTDRRVPETSPWKYAYHVTGERKIGKTTFAIEGCEELVIQFDKPQLAYPIPETVIQTWSSFQDGKIGFEQVLRAVEAKAEEAGKFPYDRIVIDGVSEWYAMCTTWACKQHGVKDPSENENWGATWRLIRETFLEAVNRLLRLQVTADCGLVFISHCEWRQKTVKGGGTVEKLESDLQNRCEKIINGKVDGWFVYCYQEGKRVLCLLGDETIGAGHRIDGHFMTPDKRRVSEIYMGDETTDATFALAQFLAAFENKTQVAALSEQLAGEKRARVSGRKKPARKKAAKKIKR